MRKPWSLLIIVSLVLSFGVPLLYGGLDSISGLARIPLWVFPLLLGMVGIGWMCNAGRVRLLACSLGVPLPFRRAVVTVISAEFAGVATPAATGEWATYLLLLSQRGLRVSRGAALVAIDKLVDLVFFSTAVPIAALLYAVDGGLDHPLRVAGVTVALLLAGLAALGLLLHHYRPVILWFGRLLHHFPRLRRTRFRLARSIIQFRRSVRVLLGMGPRRMALVYMFCVAHWMLRYSMLPILLSTIGHPVAWSYLFVVQQLLLFAGMATFLPGGGGGVEIGFSAILGSQLDTATTATALLAWRFVTFYWYLIAGAPVFLWSTGRWAHRLVALGQGRHKAG